MSDLKRIIIHWTVGKHIATNEEKTRYHFLVEDHGDKAVVVAGVFKPEDNINCKDGKYAEHVGGMNTGSIGISICSMLGYKDTKHFGDFPITVNQIETLCKKIAELAHTYGIEINLDNVETHYAVSEKVKSGKIVRNSLTEKNIGKIDIMFCPCYPSMSPEHIQEMFIVKSQWYYNKAYGKKY